MPAAMHSFYLRKMYQQNLLAKPGGITLADTPIDLSKVRTPTFILATREDHMRRGNRPMQRHAWYSGPIKFVFIRCGAIWAGVISPARHQIWPRANDKLPSSPDEWFGGATPNQGSWGGRFGTNG